jgi:hypothetical protein
MRLASIVCWAAFGILACNLGGCGGGGPDAATIEANKKAADLESKFKVDSKEDLKKRLTDISQSGVGGSGMAGLRSSIEGLRGSDAALADALLADLKALEAARGPDEIKPIAAQMAARL